jgi:hypothetical protein
LALRDSQEVELTISRCTSVHVARMDRIGRTTSSPAVAPKSGPGFITGDSQGLEVEPEWEPLGVAG